MLMNMRRNFNFDGNFCFEAYFHVSQGMEIFFPFKTFKEISKVTEKKHKKFLHRYQLMKCFFKFMSHEVIAARR